MIRWMVVVLLLVYGVADAGTSAPRKLVVAGGTAAADETFNATGYDLGAAWTETDTLSVVDPDNTTQAVSGQSLYVNQNLTVTESFVCYDYGSGASSRSVTLKMYLDTLTMPASGDVGVVVSLGSDNVTPSQTEGIIIQGVNTSGTLNVQGRGTTYGTVVAYSGIADSWVDVSISYTQNGTTTITVDGSDSSVTTPDVAARYLCLGGVAAFDSDEVAQVYYDDVDGL